MSYNWLIVSFLWLLRTISIEKLDTAKDDDVPAKQYLVRRSKKLPKWLWIAIAQSLG